MQIMTTEMLETYVIVVQTLNFKRVRIQKYIQNPDVYQFRALLSLMQGFFLPIMLYQIGNDN